MNYSKVFPRKTQKVKKHHSKGLHINMYKKMFHFGLAHA